jgi:hypothetical protein
MPLRRLMFSTVLLVRRVQEVSNFAPKKGFEHAFGANKEKPVAQVKRVSWLSHRLRNNMGSHDRFLRSLLGAALVLVAWLFQFTEAFWLGLFLITTAAFRFCPQYALFNITSLGPADTKTVIPWEEFLDLFPPAEPLPALQPEVAKAQAPKATLVSNAPSYGLPPELTTALIQDIEKNALDEVLLVRFYENFFGCKVSIQASGYLNVYVCQFPDKSTRLDFSKLKASLLKRLHEQVP